MRLPGGDNVRIEDRKVRSYLLSTAHPVGRFKARVFASAGFTESNDSASISEIRRVAAVGEIASAEDTSFGKTPRSGGKQTIPGTLTGPAKAVQVLTV